MSYLSVDGYADVAKIYENVKATRRIETTDAAKLLRIKLREAFPGVKFSVRKKSYSSIYVDWENGPNARDVRRITDRYSFGGFDGMIDMAYNVDNWMTPDGDMTRAKSAGTISSMGVHAAFDYEAPSSDAVLVESGPDYIISQRSISEDVWKLSVVKALKRFGGEWDHSRDIWSQTLPSGKPVNQYLHNSEILEEAVAEAA